MATDIEICSRALLKLGEDPISSFTDGTDISDTCGVLYPEFAKHCLSMHSWNFARKKAQLARLTDAPLNAWKYAYQLPSDLLYLDAVYDNNGNAARPTPNYDVLYDDLHFNHTECYIDYVAEVGEEDWPAYFQEFVATAFAAELAIPVTNQQDLHAMLWSKAYGGMGDNLSGGLLGLAKKLDAKQIPPKVISYNSIIDARFGSL